jgi:excisionase family DNA binding protein
MTQRDYRDLPLLLHRRTEFADRLQISVVTLDRFIKDGRIRAVRFGRSVRIPESEAQRIAAEGFDCRFP